MTYQKLAYTLNKIEPGLYKKFKMNAANVAKEETPTDITKYSSAHLIICLALDWSDTTACPNNLIWEDVYDILFNQEL
jgi:hypothetical protein